MKRTKALVLLGTVGLLLLAGCGNAVKENPESENTDNFAVSTQVEEEKTVEQETAQEPVVTAAPAEEPEFAEDTNVYGNTLSNIFNGGLFLEEEDCFYLYNGYENCVYRTDKETGVSQKMGEDYGVHLNMVDGKLYLNRASSETIVEIDTESGEERTIREGAVEFMVAVDRELYYLDMADVSLRKLSLDTLEETVLVEEGVSVFTVSGDRVYFSLESDGNSLYSISGDGGEKVKLNDVTSYMPNVYKGRIYYLGMEEGAYSIRSMALDGSGENVVVNVDAYTMSVTGDMLYFIDNNQKSHMYRIDLTKENPVPELIELEEKIKSAINEYGMVPVSEYCLDEYLTIHFGQNYMLFMCNETMDGENYMDEYIYDFVNDEILPVAAFCVEETNNSQSSEAAAQSSEPAPQSPEPTPQQPARAYPAGNYAPGSVYGPKLSQAELDQVADVVQAYMNSYDFASMSEYEKVATAHDYLSSVCSYAPDWRYNQANTAWGALVYHEAQCSGYARAMKALCDAMGIGCYYVHADENASNPSHQWNEVCIDGNWYIIDVQANDKSGFDFIYLVSDDYYAETTGMSWDRNSVPACPFSYGR